MDVSVHTIGFTAPSGMAMISLICAAIFYVLGFASTGWYKSGSHHEGLWESCTCFAYPDESWFQATQAMMSIGLIGIGLALILILLYMYVHTAKLSKSTVIIALVFICFIAVGFMLIGFIIYGVNRKSPGWSYAMAVIGACFTLAAGILSLVQMRKSGVGLC